MIELEYIGLLASKDCNLWIFYLFVLVFSIESKIKGTIGLADIQSDEVGIVDECIEIVVLFWILGRLWNRHYLFNIQILKKSGGNIAACWYV